MSALVETVDMLSSHHAYPVRMRLPSLKNGKSGWLTVAYIPVIRPRHGASAKLKARLRIARESLLQRCLAVLLDGIITARKDGVRVCLAQRGEM